jgi:putative glutamine amidotransferase
MTEFNPSRPRIAIPVPTSVDLEYNQRSWPQYARAVEACGGEAVAVALENTPAQTAKLITSCQAILLPGSPADVNPQKFGQQPIAACAPPDRAREDVDELLLQDAHNLRKPILGICFGTQMLNVWRGGTLVQDLAVAPIDHGVGKSVAIAHVVKVAPASILGESSISPEAREHDDFLWLPVNSSHHQAIDVPGDGLRVTARSAEDGVIEGIEGGTALAGGNEHFVVAVQWHPERSFDSSRASRALFEQFVAAASAWHLQPIQASVASVNDAQ